MTEPREKKKPRILCAGGAVQDIVMRVDKFPGRRHQGAGIGIPDHVRWPGRKCRGCSRTAWRPRELCRPTRLRRTTNLPAVFFKASTREKIDCSGAIRVPGAISSVSLILIDATGEKTIATRRGSRPERDRAGESRTCCRGRRRRAPRQSLSEFRDHRFARQHRRAVFPACSTSTRQHRSTIRCYMPAVMSSRRRRRLRGTTGSERPRRRAQKARAVFQRLPRLHRRLRRSLLA